MRKVRSAPVSTLVEGPQTVVAQVVEEEVALECASPGKWLQDTPVFVDRKPCEAIHAEDDKVWLTDLPAEVQVGSEISQERLLGSLPEIFKAFRDEWAPRS